MKFYGVPGIETGRVLPYRGSTLFFSSFFLCLTFQTGRVLP